MQIAENAHKLPTNYILSSNYEYQRFNADAINAVLEQLILENSHIVYIDKGQEADTNINFFKGRYKISAITDKEVGAWNKAASNINLHLPSPNTLMPEHFDIVHNVHVDKPQALIQEDGLSLHLSHSKHFEQPKGVFVAHLNTGYDKTSPRHTVIYSLLLKGLNLSLKTLSQEAIIAGMKLKLSNRNGLVLTTSGFTDKQPALLEKEK